MLIRLSRRLLPTLLVMALVLVLGWLALHRPDAKPAAHTSVPTLGQVRQLAQLLALNVAVDDLQTSSIAGYTGGIELLLVVHGQAQVGTDLQHAAFAELDHDRRRAVLVLAQPAVLHARLDHERTELFSMGRRGLWRIVPWSGPEEQLVNLAMRQAQRAVHDAAAKPALLEQARRHAESVIKRFFRELGWEVEIRWDPAPEAHGRSPPARGRPVFAGVERSYFCRY